MSRSSDTPITVFLLVDGLGIGSSDPAINPLRRGACPRLAELLDRHAVPVDAGLGVPGIPQSATGQTALLTGINAAERMGRHVEGFPGPRLREIIRQDNVFDALARRGYASTFANGYFMSDMDDVRRRKIQSVTTVAALQAFGRVRDAAMMERHEAVYQDLTREALVPRGYTGPLLDPETAARDLVRIAAGYDLTLFEYFQTDRLGHRGKGAELLESLRLFDRFLEELLRRIPRRRWLLVLTSDHGNVEDSRTTAHTKNPVPFVAVGRGARRLLKRVSRLTDVTPALLGLYPARRDSELKSSGVSP
jgi:hypothetical protein